MGFKNLQEKLEKWEFRLSKLEQIEFELQNIIRIQKHTGNVRKVFFFRSFFRHSSQCAVSVQRTKGKQNVIIPQLQSSGFPVKNDRLATQQKCLKKCRSVSDWLGP